MVRRLFSVGCTIVALLSGFGCSAATGGTVIDVDSQSLAKIIAKHKRPLLVEWFTPTCGHCVRLEPVLESVAAHFQGKLTVVRIDSRSGGALNHRYGVKATPTMLLFKDGEQIVAARKDLQGYRTFDTLTYFLQHYVVPNPLEVSNITDIDQIVDEQGFVVVGLFESPNSAGVDVFRNVTTEFQGHAYSAIVTDPAMAESLAERYEVLEVPSVFVLKARKHVVVYEGAIKQKTLHSFVDFNAFPLVGNFSVNTFYRYKNRAAHQMLLFHDFQNSDEKELADFDLAVDSLETVALEHDDTTFLTVGHKASEEDGKKLMSKMGIVPVVMPTMAIRAQGFKGALALNALAPLNQNSIGYGLGHFARSNSGTEEYKCLVTRNKERSIHYTPDIIEKYDHLAQQEKARLGLSDDLIREVDMASFSRQLKKSWKDVMIIYTARWCSFSTRLEEIFHRMLRAGEFEELLEEVFAQFTSHFQPTTCDCSFFCKRLFCLIF